MDKKIDLMTVLKELHNISGFRISIYGTDLCEIASYPKNLVGFCGLIQKNPKAKELCVRNDRIAFEKVQKTGEVYVYHCEFGLYEAVAPLYDFGVLTGYLMMGQTLVKQENGEEELFQAACPFVKDKEVLRKAVANVPSSTKEKILSCISIMNICAEYITLTNRMNLTDRNLAHEIQKYLRKNYASDLSIDRLCRHFLCSKSTLMKTFKKTYHKTINQYLGEIRLEHAAQLLLHTTHRIYEIAEQCGFSDQNYFSKVFFKAYGITPSEYRNRGNDSESSSE